MNRQELIEDLARENWLGIQLLESLLPDAEVSCSFYTETLRRNPTDPTATDATIQLHILTPGALIECTCDVVGLESVDVGGRVEVRRGSKELRMNAFPLRKLKGIELSSSTGIYRGHATEPPEPFTLAIQFDELVRPFPLVLPTSETVEGRPIEEVRQLHERALVFGRELAAQLARQ